MQAGSTFAAVTPHPALGTLAGDADLSGDVRHWSTQADDTFDQEQPSANVQPCITVRHETSGFGEDLDIST